MTRDTLKQLAAPARSNRDIAALRRRLDQLAATNLDPVEIGNQLINDSIVRDLLK